MIFSCCLSPEYNNRRQVINGDFGAYLARLPSCYQFTRKNGIGNAINAADVAMTMYHTMKKTALHIYSAVFVVFLTPQGSFLYPLSGLFFNRSALESWGVAAGGWSGRTCAS